MSPRRILVVDDQPHIVRVIKLALGSQGYTVEAASDGIEALEKLDAGHHHVLITDVQMPRMDGRALCDAIHSRSDGPKPFILVVTARTESEHRDWIRRFPGTELLEKPVSLRALSARLADHFASEATGVRP